MANKAISELPQAQNVNNQDLFVLEQSGITKKLTAETFITEQGIIDALAEALDGHGGISSVTLSSVSGRIRTYLITFTDGSATTFQVLDGTSISRIEKTSSAGLVDTYTIFMNDGTTSFFQVRNGQDGSATWDQINGKAPAITETTESSAIANFLDGAEDIPVASLVADIEPVQSGSGDPSPSNIRPISGWTGCNVVRTGKNLLPQTNYNTARFTVASDGNVSQNNPSSATFAWLYSNGIMRVTLPAGTYTATETVTTACTASGHGVQIYDDSDVRVVAVSGGAKAVGEYSASFTLTKTTNIALVCKLYYGVAKFSIVAGSTAQSYEPYQDTTLTVDWTSKAGTVYGGTIDVATGLLTVTNGYIASYNGETLPSTWISDRDVYSSGTTPTTGAEVVYKLATPQTYQLTGQQLKTLLGTNDVWADTGNTTVEYTADTKLYIEKLTMPTEDDMVANQAITSGKYFMVGNSLYLALANIASGAQITIGTNAQRVSLADALNTINS